MRLPAPPPVPRDEMPTVPPPAVQAEASWLLEHGCGPCQCGAWPELDDSRCLCDDLAAGEVDAFEMF